MPDCQGLVMILFAGLDSLLLTKMSSVLHINTHKLKVKTKAGNDIEIYKAYSGDWGRVEGYLVL